MKIIAMLLATAIATGVTMADAMAAEPETSGPVRLETKKPGETFGLAGLTVTVKELSFLPLVENDYTRRFVFESYDNPKLRRLREQEKLDRVVTAGEDEFDRQVLLLDWTYRRFKKFGTPTSDPESPLDILRDVDAGGTFFCAHYGRVLMSAAASLGWINRGLGLRLGKQAHGRPDGATEHTITEIWSNQHGKWVMFDPTYALYVEKNGVPLNAWEIRQEWFYGDPQSLDFVIGAERKKHKAADMPIFRATHRGYGDLALGPRTIDKYAFLGYLPNTNLLDGKRDYARMFITKDALCEGISWHNRDNPKEPATEPYFPLNQSTLRLSAVDEISTTLAVNVSTMTPNFARFRSRVDGGKWQDVKSAPGAESRQPGAAKPADFGEPATIRTADLRWRLHPGTNRLEVVAVNKFGVTGTPGKVVLELQP